MSKMSVQLSRNCRPLLQVVRNSAHATSDDHQHHCHHDSKAASRFPTLPSAVSTSFTNPLPTEVPVMIVDDSDNDPDRDPESCSSSDESPEAAGGTKDNGSQGDVGHAGSGSNRDRRQGTSGACFPPPVELSQTSPGAMKRKEVSSGEDDGLFAFSNGACQRSKNKGSIFAPERKKRPGYGMDGMKRLQREQERKNAQKKNRVEGDVGSASCKPSARPVFKTHDFLSVLDFPEAVPLPNEGGSTSGFASREVRDIDSLGNISPGRDSPARTPDSDEDGSVTFLEEGLHVSRALCEFCGEEVDKTFKEDFEDKHGQKGGMSFQWKRRFCEYHRQHHALDRWKDRAYPEIEWNCLESRMRKHDQLLIRVLAGNAPSFYRDTLKEKLVPRKRGLRQAFDDETDSATGRPGASVGYYGPKGERIMIDHIISSMSEKIRQQATKDKLVAATGARGGVSGFIQSVLVPHLAELLIKEDMDLQGRDWSAHARRIITESAELGELMHPEAQDHIVEQIDDSD